MALTSSRRHFFFGSMLAGAVPLGGFGLVPSLKALGYKSPNETLNIGAIGAGGKGFSDLRGCDGENIVALCDVDDTRAARTYTTFEKAKKYKDFRKMLDAERGSLDAVIVATPDHMHGMAAMWAMQRGLHVYVQKPLVRTIWEARQLMDAGRKYKVATQMGNQGYSNEGTRQCAEMIWAGEIGNVTEVHAWTDRPMWPQGLSKVPGGSDPAPSTLQWDLWLGIAPDRPFTIGGEGYPNQYGNFYQPFNWRGFYDFGCGALGDMACHILGAPNMALRLGMPTSVEAISREGVSDFMFPRKSVTKFEFPARGAMPPVTLYWHDGCEETPKIKGVPEGEILGDLPSSPARMKERMAGMRGGQRPAYTGMIGGSFNYEEFQKVMEDPNKRFPRPDGSLFIGDKGMITTGTYGTGTRHVPVAKMKDYRFPEPLLSRSPGHYRDWIRACKGGDPACSNFDVAAPFVEWMLLGVIALRVEGKLEYDAAKMRFTNNNEANQYLKPTFRKGWTFAG
jgi:hypothetical protein